MDDLVCEVGVEQCRELLLGAAGSKGWWGSVRFTDLLEDWLDKGCRDKPLGGGAGSGNPRVYCWYIRSSGLIQLECFYRCVGIGCEESEIALIFHAMTLLSVLPWIGGSQAIGDRVGG